MKYQATVWQRKSDGKYLTSHLSANHLIAKWDYDWVADIDDASLLGYVPPHIWDAPDIEINRVTVEVTHTVKVIPDAVPDST